MVPNSEMLLPIVVVGGLLSAFVYRVAVFLEDNLLWR